MGRTVNVVKLAIAATAVLLSRLGLIDETRGRRVADLAWPRVVTGLARKSKTTVDLAMVGIAIGPAAIAGLGFAFAFYSLAMGIAYSLADGALTFYSQRFGADDREGFDLAVKQTLWIELALASVIATVFVVFATQLIGLLGPGSESLAHGTLYLQVVAIALFFEMPNKIGSRALIAANDAWSPMVIRASGAVLNIVLNAVFIFGLGLGVLGAALGTVLATFIVAVTFVVGLSRGRLPGIGALPVRVGLSGPYVDREMIREILEVGSPLMVRRVVTNSSNFLMLAIVAYFGTVVVAAYVLAREVRGLMNTPGWGFGTAAHSLVGQALGADDEPTAGAYGRDVLRFAVAVYVMMAVAMFAFSEQIATLFTDDPVTIQAAAPFILVMAVSLVGLGVDGASTGILSAGGDTRWPLYAQLVGLYAFMLPIAYLGVVTPLGVLAIYVAVTAETVVPALVTYYRFRSDAWKVASRRYRPSVAD